MSGYFFAGSNDGGLTIQPCTLVPPVDVYQISSVFASCLPASRSALTSVNRVTCGVPLRLYFTTSCGRSGSVWVPAATRSRDIESNVRMCVPVVTSFGALPEADAK